jgi:hypothetical protein
LLVLLPSFSINTYANEVGNQNFGLDPKASPVFVSKKKGEAPNTGPAMEWLIHS